MEGNDHPEHRGGGHDADAEGMVVLVLDEGRNHEAADRHHRGHRGAGDGTEKAAGQHPRHGQAAGQKAHQGIGGLDEFCDDAAGGHDIAAEDEKQHHDEGELVHAAIQHLDHDLRVDTGQGQAEQAGEEQRHEDRYGGHQSADQQGENNQITDIHK